MRVNQLKKWKLRDVILLSILGVLFAAAYLAVFDVGLVLSALLTPSGLSTFAFELIYGIWFMAAVVAAYIIRKPGVALIAELLASAIELLMGNSGGAVLLVTGIIQGLGAELGFAVFRYKKYNLFSMSLSGIFAALFIYVYELFYLQNYLLAPGLLAAKLVVRIVSAVVFSGLTAKAACDGLARTGVLKNYGLGLAQQDIDLEEEEEL